MYRSIIAVLLLVPCLLKAENIVVVPPTEGDATAVLQAAIDKAGAFNGKNTTIRLTSGKYNISRSAASEHLYYISNTASAEENPGQMKHIGLWFRNMRNITFDGNGATIITHGEMTPFVLDSCRNVTLKNFTLTAADPSVPELKILEVEPQSIIFEVCPPSRFEISEDGNFSWVGEGWRFADGTDSLPELAQVFYPERNVTHRCASPLRGRKKARVLDGNIIKMEFDKAPDVHPGEIYQMRHGIRNEACGFFNMSENVTLSNIEFNFLGNFGLVGQFTRNLTYDNIRCRSAEGSGRTDAGFADFVQMSGCRGKITIRNSYFEGAHDDPINIHGTHLKVIKVLNDRQLRVRFMHGQTYGFTPFFADDKIEFVDRHSLRCLAPATVVSVQRKDDYEFDLTLDRPISLPEGRGAEDFAVENITWTPEVEICGNYFARTPTRGILITTRGKSVIEGNTFFRIPMPAILVSDDARGWYESGPVKNLLIRNNTFIECNSPAIAVWPEVEHYEGYVHENIRIERNRFIMEPGTAISLRATKGITIKDNIFELNSGAASTINTLIQSEHTTKLTLKNNQILNR